MKNYLLLLITLIASPAHARLQIEWEYLFPADVYHTSDLATDEHRLYLGAFPGIYVSRDHGATWQLTFEVPDGGFITGIAVGRRSVYACSDTNGVFRSDTRRALNWEPKSKGLARIDAPDWPIGDYYILESIHITRTNAIVAINSHHEPYMSTDRGESWKYMGYEWLAPHGHIHAATSLYDFDGELWLCNPNRTVVRSPDNGKKWIWTAPFKRGPITQWTEFNGKLYAAGQGFGRYNPDKRDWDYFGAGIELKYVDSPTFHALAVNRGRLFAATLYSGIYLFDEHSETFVPIGFQDGVVADLVSHQGHLYAAVEMPSLAERDQGLGGVYRASIPRVQSYGKAAAIWGAIKRP